MADIRVRYVDYADEQAANQPFPVEVGINNNETVGPIGWGPVVCPDSGAVNSGHMTDVTLTVRDSNGSPVETYEEGLCVPVNRPSEFGSANAVAEFTVSLPPGDYTLAAEVQVRGDNGHDSAQPKQLTVTDGTDSLDGGDADRGWWTDPGPEGGDDPDSNPANPLADVFGVSPSTAKLLAGGGALLIALMILSPYAQMGASIAGGAR